MDRRRLLATLLTTGTYGHTFLTSNRQASENRIQGDTSDEVGCPAAEEFSSEVEASQESAKSIISKKIDTNVTLFRWPSRRVPLDRVKALEGRLRTLGITEAWACSFEGILHRDITTVNVRLHERCKKHPFFRPCGVLNLSLPSWKRDFVNCVERHSMHGVRLYPNYHDYSLGGAACEELFEMAARLRVLVQIVVSLEDSRTQNRMLSVPDTDLKPLCVMAKKYPKTTFQLLNLRYITRDLHDVFSCQNILVDTARIDGTDGVSKLVEQVSPSRVLYGSHSPLLIPEASMIRMHESALSLGDQQSIFFGNASEIRALRGEVPSFK